MLLSIKLTAQVGVAPTALFIDPDSRSASMFVNNPTENTVEVDVSLIFGYSATDSLGASYIEYADSVMAEKYSLYPYVTIFPRKFTMKPKQQQTVRFVLKNTQKLPDGIYWTRIKTESGKIQEQLDSQNVDGVKVLVNMRMAMVTGVFYKKGEGDNNTALNLIWKTTRQDTSKLFLVYDGKREGTMPFFGTAKLVIKDSENKIVEEKEEQFSMYRDGLKAYEFDIKKFPKGKYKSEITISYEHKIFPKEYLIKGKTQSITNEFTVE
jgi:hypothetical protein